MSGAQRLGAMLAAALLPAMAAAGSPASTPAGTLPAARPAPQDLPEPVPCDTTRIDLEPDGEPVDVTLAFQNSVLQLVTHRLVGVAEERATAILHLDEVDLRQTGDGRNGVRLRKSIGPRVQVSYVAPVGHASEQRLRLEFRINASLAFQSESDQQGKMGSDLLLRLPWR